MIRQINSLNFKPSFGVKYTNYDGSKVRLNEKGVQQVEQQMKIRQTVEEALRNAPDDITKNGEVYFAINSDGSCVVSKEKMYPLWTGKAWGFEPKDNTKRPNEIMAYKQKSTWERSSDKDGRVRANGIGENFASIYSNGYIKIWDKASRIFPEE